MSTYMKTALAAASSGAILCALASNPASAAGFYLQEQSARGTARAYSGEAADTGSASMWWNPAAIGLGAGHGDAYVGGHWITVGATVTDAGSTIQRPVPGLPAQPVGGVGVQTDPVDSGVVPNLGASWRVNDQWAVGLSVNAPFNFTSRYAPTSWTRYQALKSTVFNVDVQPTLAWRPTPQLALGAGFDFSFVRSTLSNALPNPSPLLPDASSVLHGKGWDNGWTAGLQWRPDPSVTFGLSYRSRIRHKLDGTVAVQGLLGPAAVGNVNAAAQANFRTPSIVTGAVRWQAAPKLTLEAQVQRFGWSAFDAITVAYAGRTQVIPQNYRDTTSAAVGAEYAYAPQLTLRAGVQRDPTPTPDAGRTARVTDGGRWLISGGATYKASDAVAVDLAVMHLAFDQSTINSRADAFSGTPLNTPINMAGNITGHSWVLSAGLRFDY